jgi:drug/metabolite transporter (DMT)-like permease
MMATLLALVATVLTSFLPILQKLILRDARPALVAWIINVASLPILAVGTGLVTSCSLLPLHGGIPFTCAAHLPDVDGIFVAALLTYALLNWAATLLATYALAKADVSLVGPLLTFNPAFTLLIAWPALGEMPGLRQTVGVAVALFGVYLLNVEEARTGRLAPLRVLLHRPGAALAILASALWGTTTVLEKLAIDHMSPKSGPAVALLGTFLLVVLLTPGTPSDELSQRSRLPPGEPGMASRLIDVHSSAPSCLQAWPRSSGSQPLRLASSGMSRPSSSSAPSSACFGHGCSSAKASSRADCLGRA